MHNASCTVLVADDDQFIRDSLADLLRSNGRMNLQFAGTAKETWAKLEQEDIDLVLLDIKFPDSHDLTLLKRIRTERPHVQVIVLTSQTENIGQVVEAIKLGAFDYVPKPFADEELLNRIERALETQSLRRAHELLVRDMEQRNGLECLIGRSAVMEHVRKTILRLSEVDGCVLVEGDSGTGKELAARALHLAGKRRNQPLIVINCASVPENLVESTFFGHRRGAFTGAIDNVKGKFEIAEGGTIFLDEIGDMPLPQQAALLRVLEYRKFMPVGDNRERECRARFVLATNRDLREEVRLGRFREDLHYRIRVASIEMPPLAARVEDIPLLTAFFCDRLTTEMGRSQVWVSPGVKQRFDNYDWPGNVRELKNVLEGMIMMMDPRQQEIEVADLPAEFLALPASGDSKGPEISAKDLRDKSELIRALRQCSGNQSQAAKLLGCHRNTIRSRIRYFGITSLYQDQKESQA